MQQASMLSCNDAWLFILIAFPGVSPAILLLRKPKGSATPVDAQQEETSRDANALLPQPNISVGRSPRYLTHVDPEHDVALRRGIADGERARDQCREQSLGALIRIG